MDKLAQEILKDITLDEFEPRSTRLSTVDHWSPPILLERAAFLKKMARLGNGSAVETVREYPQHTTMLLYRSRDGDAEMYEGCSILFCVLAGAATLVTGGTLTRARVVGPGVSCGDSIEGGNRTDLKAGDIAHVASGISHQLLVAGEKSVVCFVVKIRETA
jgi:hypothetical protein